MAHWTDPWNAPEDPEEREEWEDEVDYYFECKRDEEYIHKYEDYN